MALKQQSIQIEQLKRQTAKGDGRIALREPVQPAILKLHVRKTEKNVLEGIWYNTKGPGGGLTQGCRARPQIVAVTG